jgi:ubiquinol-cytochrome c reductase cytochrome c1 subunit
MIRLFAILIGLVFSGVAFLAFAVGAYTFATEEHVPTAEHEFHLAPKEVEFSFNGPLGKWDQVQLQRGYKVYKEVCSACHSLKFVAFRDLADLGYSEAQVKALAAEWQVPGINPDTGEATLVPGKPTDHFPLVYPNNVAAAAANNNAVPPDLSLMTKAREDGSNYVHALLTGFADAATYKNAEGKSLKEEFPDFSTPKGLHFNPYFANLNLAMAPPLTASGQVTYDDGTPATVDQMATDVAAFLTWTAEPKMQQRKQTGLWFTLFLLFATVLAFFSYKNIWAGMKPKKPEAE